MLNVVVKRNLNHTLAFYWIWKSIFVNAIPLHLLETGKTYIGFCRNASEAVWLGDKFEYMRTKFGSTFTEKINHFQNDDGYDVFVPVKVKK